MQQNSRDSRANVFIKNIIDFMLKIMVKSRDLRSGCIKMQGEKKSNKLLTQPGEVLTDPMKSTQ